MSSVLFTPIELRELRLRNRIMLSPMCQYAAANGCAGDWHLSNRTACLSSQGKTRFAIDNVNNHHRIPARFRMDDTAVYLAIFIR